ncbi:MAG: hypothetical protein WB643_11690 [Candidatus Bathyarchaeia archaeon]
MTTTRKKILTIGLLLFLAGVFTLEQGPLFLSPIAQTLGLASHYQTEIPVLPTTLIAVPATNYTALSVNLRGGTQVEGALEVADGHEVAFYVMDQGNFSQWRAGEPSAIILARPTVISSNFTFTPTTSSTYYFVFDNQDTARRVVIFSLNTVENATLLNPIIEFAGYEILLVGIILCLLGIKSGQKHDAISGQTDRWKCKFCNAKNTRDLTFCEKCGRSQR